MLDILKQNVMIDICYYLCYYHFMINPSDQHLESLEKFQLSYEHDRTWNEAKKAVKERATTE